MLKEGWWNEAREYVEEERVGLIWGVEIAEFWHERLAHIRARGIDPIDYSIQHFKVRGGLHDMLLRREALSGIVLPSWLNVYEDAWVKLFVECRGFMWKIVKTEAIQLRRERRGYCNCREGRLIYPRRMWCRVEAKLLGVVGLPRCNVSSCVTGTAGGVAGALASPFYLGRRPPSPPLG